jgi:hypothetical protein
MKYWFNPTCKKSQAIDLLVSKTFGVIYFCYGYKNVQSYGMRMIGYGNFSLILLFYQLSCSLYSNNNPRWISAHIVFHCFTTLGQFIVMY